MHGDSSGEVFPICIGETNQGHKRAHQFKLLSGLDSRIFSLAINFPFPKWGFHTPRVKQIAVWIFMSFGRKK